MPATYQGEKYKEKEGPCILATIAGFQIARLGRRELKEANAAYVPAPAAPQPTYVVPMGVVNYGGWTR